MVRQADEMIELSPVGQLQEAEVQGHERLLAVGERGDSRPHRIAHVHLARTDPRFRIRHAGSVPHGGGRVHQGRLHLRGRPLRPHLAHQRRRAGHVRRRHRRARLRHARRTAAGLRGNDAAPWSGDVRLEKARRRRRAARATVVELVRQIGARDDRVDGETEHRVFGEPCLDDRAVGLGDHHAGDHDVARVAGAAHHDGFAGHVVDHDHRDGSGALDKADLVDEET